MNNSRIQDPAYWVGLGCGFLTLLFLIWAVEKRKTWLKDTGPSGMFGIPAGVGIISEFIAKAIILIFHLHFR